MKREIVFTREELDEGISRIADKLNEIYKDAEEAPIFIGVLKGAIPFMMDLVKKCNFDMKMDFIQVSSFSGTASTGVIHLKKDITENIKNKDIVIVEDIIDTGLTLNYLKQYIQLNYQPRSIKIVCLVDKIPLRKVDLVADIVGFTILQNKFLVGYGFDYNEYARSIDYVFVPSTEELEAWDKKDKKY